MDNDAGKIFAYRQSDQSFYEDHELRGGNNDPFGLVIIGSDMWVGDDDDAKMYHYTIADNGGISRGTLDITFASVNDDPRGMAVRDIRGSKFIYVVDSTDHYVYVYNVSARGLDTPRGFNLSGGHNNPWGVWVQGDMLWADDRDDDVIRAYDLSDSSQATDRRRYIDVAPENGDPRAFWSDGTAVWLLDNEDRKFYKYDLITQRDRAEDFNLDSANGEPAGMTCYPSGVDLPGTSTTGPAVLVIDTTDTKAYGYRLLQSGSRTRLSDLDFDLHVINFGGWGITIDSTNIYVSDTNNKILHRYTADTATFANSRFVLHSDNDHPRGVWRGSSGNVHVVDSQDNSIYVYAEDGIYGATRSLPFANVTALGIWSTGTVFYVVQQLTTGEDSLLAYRPSDFTRLPQLDITLSPHNRDPMGVCGVGERLWVVDRIDDKVYAYSVVRDSNAQPEFAVDAVTFTVDENATTGTVVGSSLDVEEDGDTLVYSISGTHAAYFSVDSATGEITVGDHADGLDFETTPTLSVTLEVRDNRDADFEDDTVIDDTVAVTISLNNLQEEGHLTIDVPTDNRAKAGVSISATIIDPDGGVTAERWKWQKRTTGGSWEDIAGATNATYAPVAADIDETLRVQVTYTDTVEPLQSLTSRTFDVVTANRDPTFDAQAVVSVDENSGEGVAVGEPVTAVDLDGDDLTYSLRGGNSAFFTVDASTGQIRVGSQAVLDAEFANFYMFRLRVTDNKNSLAEEDATIDDTIPVIVRVLDVEEDGVVALDPDPPEADHVVTASLSDPDGGVSGVTWQWQERLDGGSWSDITGADSATFTPSLRHIGNELRAIASYNDQNGDNKSAMSAAATVAPANSEPSFAAETERRSVNENDEGADVGAVVVATDDDGDTLFYSISGTDASLFAVNAGTGQISVAAGTSLDYETKSTYSVVISVSDRKDMLDAPDTVIDDTVAVMIDVVNVNDNGTVNLPAEAPLVGDQLTAELSDPDGTVSGVSWKWEQSRDNGMTWAELSGTTESDGGLRSTYSVLLADVGSAFRITATYTDVHAASQEATGTTANTLYSQPSFPDSDENGVADPYSFSVAEHSGGGTVLGSVRATDPDGDTLTYSVSGGGATRFLEAFEVNSINGEIMVKSGGISIDYERQSSYVVIVGVSDEKDDLGEPSFVTDDAVQVTVSITNLNEPAIFTLSVEGVTIETVTEAGKRIDAMLLDPDGGVTGTTWQWQRDGVDIPGATSNRYTPGLDDIDALLRVRATYTDVLGRAAPTSYQFLVRAANDDPEFSSNTASRTVDENSVATTAVGALVAATDDDGDTLTYSLDGTDAALFAVDSTTGQIRVASGTTLNFEAKSSYAVVLRVTDGKNALAQADASIDDTIQVAITIKNVNETGVLSVSTPHATTATTAAVTDPDAVTGSNPTGAVSAVSPWLWEVAETETAVTWETTAGTGSTTNTYTPTLAEAGKWLRVTAVYADPVHETTHTLRSVVGPVKPKPNEPPSFPDDDEDGGAGDGNADAFAFTIDENSAGTTPVGAVAATDPDGDTLTYSVSGADATAFQAAFALNTSTGQISVKPGGVVNFELKLLYTIRVGVTDNKDSEGNADSTVDDTVAVTIDVNNVDEPGSLSFTRLNPTAGTSLTAMLVDPDQAVESVIWQWQRSSLTMVDVWEDISGAASASYTPSVPDIGRFLRAVVSYTDFEGPGKTVTASLPRATVAATGSPMFDQRTVSRHVDENSAGGVRVGNQVGTFDPDGDTLTYSLGGDDASSFTIDTGSGQIRVAAGADLNFETKPLYSVTVSVTDGKDSGGNADPAVDDTVVVTIDINNVDEPGTVTVTAGTPTAGTALTATLSDPDGGITSVIWQWQSTDLTAPVVWEDIEEAESASYTPTAPDIGRFLRVQVFYFDAESQRRAKTVASAATAAVAAATRAPMFADRVVSRSVDEDSAGGVAVGEPVRATDADGDTLTYSLGGINRSSFTIDTRSGQIRVAAGTQLNHEFKQAYTVTVSVTDGKDSEGNTDSAVDDTVTVTIAVNNVEEPGTVTVTAGTPTAGTALTATLSDPDGSVTGVTWQWQRTSLTMFDVWEDISGAESASYTPGALEIGRFLRAVASYTDGEGSGKTATSGATVAVAAATGAPTFADRVVSRSVDENSAGGVAVGEPVEADDADGDTLTYSLDGDDASSFTIDAGSGQIRVAVGADLDFETKPLYSVTVSVTDSKDSEGNADSTVDGIVVVTINVDNVDDDGSVAVTAGTPTAGTALTATLSDPDGSVMSVSWQWQRTSRTMSDVWEDITDTESDSYTPTANDIGRFLRAVASYTDGEGSGKTATSGATVAVAAATGAPTFADRVVSRSVDENSAGGVAVGEPVEADDADGDTLTYSLDGDDASSFTIDTGSGQIRVAAGADLDFETKPLYSVTVSVTDSKDSEGNADSTVDGIVVVTINVDNVDEAGSVTVTPVPAAGTALTATLSDPDGGVMSVTWQWQRTSLTNTGVWGAITGAVSASYTPDAQDIGRFLRVVASYTDAEGSGKTATSGTTAVVATATGAPTFADRTVSRSVDENSAGEAVVGDPVAARHDEGDIPIYSLSGTDASSFTIDTDSGQIRVAAGGVVDFETKPQYRVTVNVTDGQDADGQADTAIDDTVAVTINVTNLDEAGSVTVKPAPAAGFASTAEVADPDGTVTNVTSWVWEVAATRNADTWTAAAGAGAATDTYTPAVAETGMWLRVTAVYDDPVFAAAATVRAVAGPVGAANPQAAFPDVVENGGVGDGTADPVSFSVEENAAATTVVGTVAATDDDGDTLTYTVTGTDATAFGEAFALGANSGQITVAAGGVVDFETKPQYTVTVNVTDGEDADGQADTAIDDMVTVTINVTNLDEPGSVTVKPAPVAGFASTAEVADPDGAGATVTSWAWEVAAARDADTWTAAAGAGAATDTYTPAVAETGMWLRVTAVYDDPVFTTAATVRAVAGPVAPGDVKASFGAAAYTVAEGDGVTVTVTLDADPERTVTIAVTATNENSASDDDYSGVPASVTFNSGETSKTLTFTATQDSDDDDDERVRLAFDTLPSGVSAGTTAETVVSITDDDAPADVKASFGAPAYTVAEGDGVTVTVTLDADPERTVTIAVTATNENSASDDDYSGVPASVTFNSGETSKTLTFTATQDSDDDDDERVRLAFDTLPSGVSEGTTAETVVSITDDDAPADVKASFGAPAYTVAEGDGVTVTVTLDADPERTVTIAVTATNENSASDDDYSGVPASVTFNSGETSKTLTFTATQDSDDDDDERVRLAFDTLPSGVSEGTTAETVVSITDDDAPDDVKASFGAPAYTVAEGAGVTVTVTLDADPERTVTIAVTATNENSASDDDYSGVPASVTFNSGETSKTLTFTATQDSDDDDDERVRLAFDTLPSGVSEGTTAETVVSITDDDAPDDVKASFGAPAYTVAEGDGVTVTVTLDADPERTVTIAVTATNENSASDDDYSGVPASVTFNSGETSKTLTFTATQDSDDDDDERVRLAFDTLPSGVSEGTTAETVVSITDDDAPADVKASFGAPAYTVAEGDGVTVTVTLDADPERTVTIAVTATNENSASDDDYSGVPASVTFNSGETSKTLTFTATQDSDDDDDERVRLAFDTLPSGVSEGTTAETVVSITDDDAPDDVKASFGAPAYTVAEGDGVTVTVTLDADPERTVTIAVTATNENSASDDDYSGVPASVTFNSGETSKTLTFTATQDSDDDDDERVRLAFDTLPSGVSEGTTAETVVSITDDDAPDDVKASFGAPAYTVAEGDGVTVTVTLDADPERTVTIAVTATNENSASDDDYSGVPASVTFNSGETSKTLTFTATQDSDDDDDERVRLAFDTLPSGVSEGTTAETVVSITDDDAPDDVKASFGAPAYTVAEGDGVTVTVTLDADPERTVTIAVTATNENSASDDDYSGVPASVTFNSGETSKTLTFTATQDSDDDDDERVRLAFDTLPSGVSEGTTAETVVSITDDDAPDDVKASFGAPAYTVAEGDGVTVTVTLDADPERTVTIAVTATNENSASDDDYSGVPASVTFNSGETSKTLTFTATQDSDDDDDERVRLAFDTLPSGVSEGTTAETVVSITDDDAPDDVKASFGAPAYTVAEGAGVTVTVTLDADPERTVTIAVTATNENSASDDDYSGVPASVTFNSGETSKTLTFTATQDSDDDDDERVRLAFDTLPSGVSEGTTAETVVSITDDDAPDDVKASFGAPAYTVAEGDGVTVTVTLDADPERTVTIAVTATNENSASDDDYSGVPASVTFNSGETSKTLTFTATQDSDDDDDERVRLAFDTLPSGVSEGTTAETVVSITDDDAPADVKASFGAPAYTVAEGDGVTVTVTLDADPERTVTIAVTATNENSASDDDYSGVPASVTFNSGETSKTLTFTATQDSDDDDDERVRLAFDTLPSGVSEGTTAETVVSITDDDAPDDVKASFGAPAYTVAEGDGVTVTVTLDADPERTVTIAVTATNENSASDDDYSGVPASVTFNSGETSKTLTFTATQDSDDDDDERVRLAFDTLPSGVSAGTTAETVVSITDDDAPADVKASFGAPAYTVAEGDGVTVTVTLDADPERTVTIAVTATNENSASDDDYSGVPASVTFNSGETSKTLTFTATQDSDDDDDERVRLAFDTLPSGVSAGTTAETVVSITDDDAPADVKASFGAPAYTVAEGDGVTVTVTLDADPERTVTIAVTATNENSASDDDYSGVPASVTFNSGETSKTLTFTATQDSDDDDDERVRLAFDTLPSGVSEGTTAETVVSITDDDAPADVKASFGAPAYTVAEGDGVTVTVTLDADPERTVTIAVTATNENSASDDDYSGVPASVTFNSGETSKTLTFTATQDSDDDDDERVRLAFDTLPSGVSEGTTAETVVSITDDDAPDDVKASFGAPAYTVAEGDGVTVTVTLDADPERTVTIAVTATNENSASDDDYSGVPASVTFNSGETSKTLTFTATQDSDDDDDERVRLAFDTLPSGVSEGTTAETVVSITDDDAPDDVKASFGAPAYTVAEGAGVTVTVTLDADPERTVTIAVTATNENSASDDDYSGVPASVTFNSGETSKTLTFTATQDSDDDDDERVRLAFDTLPSGVSEGTTAETVVSITDDDAPDDVKASFGAPAYTVAEGDGVTVTVTLDADPERTVTIAVTATNENSASDDDYSGVPASVTFNSGETSKTLTFTATQDSDDDDDERVRLAFDTLPSGVSEGTTAETVVSITDDDAPADVKASFGAPAYTVAEGDGVTVTVTLDADPERTVTIAVTATNENSASDDDYSGVPASVTFNSGETSKTLTFTATQDSDDDDDERVRLAFDTLPSGVSEGTTAETVVSITDDDAPDDVKASFGAPAYTVAEGDGVTVTVTLDADPERTVTIAVTATNENSASDDDYSGVPASVTFNSGETSKTLTFTATQDSDDDDDERVRLAFDTLPSGVSAGTTAETVVSITDDDAPADVKASFGAPAYTVAEGDGVTVTVTLDADPERTVTIAVTATNENSASDDDYSGVPASVTFNSGETSKTLTFTATQDSDDDDDERVRLAFDTLPSGVSEGTTAETVVSITDDDAPADVKASFGAPAYTVAEGDGVTVTVTLDADPERTVTIAVTATNENSASDDDYSGVPASVTFNSGETSKTLTFTATQDSDDDDDERVRLAFDTLPSGVSEGTTAETVVSITDDDAPDDVKASFGAPAYTVAEGDGVTVTVTLDADPERTVTIAVTATNENSASDDDYSGVPASVTFNSGETSKTLTFTATQDSDDDDDERVRLAFDTLPSGVSEGTTAETVVSITDDDAPADVKASFGAPAYTVAEGDGVTVTVTLDADPERTVTIAVTATNENSASDDDYSGVPASVTFNSGETSKTLTFTATQDSDDDDDERVRLAFDTLPSGVSEGTTAETVVSITDDDAPDDVKASFGAPAYTVAEGDGVTVTVTLDADPERTVTIAVTATNENSASDDDYSGVPASVTFNSGETSKTLTFTATQDSDDDDDERVRLAFDTLPSGVSAGTTAETVVSITDDDAPDDVKASFGAPAYTVAEGDGVTVTVTLDADPERTVTIAVTATNENSASDDDYSGVPASVTFNSGETSKTLTFTATQDSDDDDDERVRLAFDTLPSGVSEGTTAETVVSITDDDAPADVKASFGAPAYTVAEGDGVTVTVTLDADPERTVTIAVTATNENSASDDDYSGVPASVTFNSGETSKTLTFTATQDSDDDDDERVRLAFDTLPSGVSEGTTAETVVSITDDDAPAVTITGDAPTIVADPWPPAPGQCSEGTAVTSGVVHGTITRSGDYAYFGVIQDPFVVLNVWIRGSPGPLGALPNPKVLGYRNYHDNFVTGSTYGLHLTHSNGWKWYPATTSRPRLWCFAVASGDLGVGHFEVKVEVNTDPLFGGAPGGYVSDIPGDITTDARTRLVIPSSHFIGDDNAPGDDVDWYGVSLEAGVEYRVTAVPLHDVAARHRLNSPIVTGVYDGSGTLMAGTSSGGGGPPAVSYFTPPSDGAYFVGVSTDGTDPDGLYLLCVDEADQRGRCAP